MSIAGFPEWQQLALYAPGAGVLLTEQHCEKWGLPRDYQMVLPSYSARSRMAKSIGVGRKVAPAAKRGRAKA